MEYAYRQATESDIQALTDIYNAAVVAGGSSADIAPRTIEQRRAWLDSHKAPYAVFVTEAGGVEHRVPWRRLRSIQLRAVASKAWATRYSSDLL